MYHNSIKKIWIVPLFSLIFTLSIFAESSPVESTYSQTLPVDLTEHTVYAKKGFSIEEVNRLSQANAQPADWQLLPAEKRARWLGIESLGIEGVEPRGFFNPGPGIDEHFMFLVDVPLTKENIETRPLGLVLGHIGMGWQVFVNGQLVEDQLFLEGNRLTVERSVRFEPIPLPAHVLKEGQNRIIFHIFGNPHDDSTGLMFQGPYLIDHIEKIYEFKSEKIYLALITLYLFMGFYHLLLYIRRRQEKYNLYFALFTISLFVYLMTRSKSIFDIMLDTNIITRVELSSLYISIPFLVAFFEDVTRKKLSIFVKLYFLFNVFLAIVNLFVSHVIKDDILLLWQMTFPLPAAFLIYTSISAMIKHIKYRRTNNTGIFKAIGQTILYEVPGNLLVGMMVIISTATWDIIDSIWLHTGIQITPLGFFVFVTGIAVSLANSFLTVHNKVEELNEELEDKVELRTAELTQSLKQVQKLKEKQDGDYFLTSLLLAPLGINRSKNENVQVEFYVEQKKKFKFRNWRRDIGGDICIADTIDLKGRKYTVFLNADAMGKSMQGAGGALVLGSVFHSVLDRTKNTRAFSDHYPERWLKNTFLELHNIFVSFDGSMLMSLVFGLVDVETGFVYFMNAEHPWTALYRDKKAGFIENELVFRKLGMPGLNGSVFVRTFQLHEGDVLFLGSDGRDDLIIGTDNEGNRMIQEDENLFLRIVEIADGQLDKVISELKNIGELSDDLSLLRIAFREKASATSRKSEDEQRIREHIVRSKKASKEGHYELALAELETAYKYNNANPRLLKEMARVNYNMKDFKTAAKYAEDYCSLRPEDTDFIFLASYCHKRSRNFERAIDLGERVRLRQPEMKANLINLADLYMNNNQPERAREFINSILEKDPENKQAIKLRQSLQEG